MARALVLLLLANISVEGPEESAAWFRERVPRMLAEVTGALGMRFEGDLTVRLARTEAEFGHLAGSHPSWVAAVALPRDGSLIVRLPALGPERGSDVSSVIRHEIVHVVLPARVGGSARVPRWFEEGLAQVMGGRVNRLDLSILPAKAAAGTLIPLPALASGFPRDEAAAGLAYAEGESVVLFLLDRHGREGLLRLLDGVRESASFEAALAAETGLTVSDLEREWRSWLSAGPWLVALILPVFLPFLLFLASLLVIAGALRARRRGRETYEALPE